MTWFRRQDPKEVAKRVREKVERWEREQVAAQAEGKATKPEDYGKLADECHQAAGEAGGHEPDPLVNRADWAIREWQRIRQGEAGAGSTMIDPDPSMTVDDVAAIPALADRLTLCGADREWLREMGVGW